MAKNSIEIDMVLDLTKLKTDLNKAQKLCLDEIKRINKNSKLWFSLDTSKIKSEMWTIQTEAKKTVKKINEEKITPKTEIEDFKKKLKETEIYARDTKVKLDSEMIYDMRVNIDNYEQKIKEAQKLLKQFDPKSEEARNLRLTISDYKSNLNEAKRQFNNYVNTGEKSLSRLQKKFNDIKNEMWQWKLWWVLWTLNNIKMWWLAIAWAIWWAIKKVVQFVWESAKIYESQEMAFARVKKTVDATEKEYDKLRKSLTKMSERIPKTFEELSSIMAFGGQMWIAKQDLEKFTETVAKLWTAIDWISDEDAATTLARMMWMTKESIQDMDKVSSALVELWNNYKATEWEILAFAQNIAWAWAVVWLTSADILWISTAFVDVWVQAEAWWSAVMKALLKMNDAVAQGGDSLAWFAQISWMSAEEFSNAWKEDSAMAFTAFVNWLTVAWDDANWILNELLWTDIRLQRAFLSLANSWDVLNQTLESSRQGYEENIALQKEFWNFAETNANQLQLLANKWDNFKASIWEWVSNLKVRVAAFLWDMITRFQEVWPKIKAFFEPTISFWKELATTISWIVKLLVDRVITYLKPIILFFANLRQTVWPYISQFYIWIVKVVQAITALLNWNFSKAWELIKQGAINMVKWIAWTFSSLVWFIQKTTWFLARTLWQMFLLVLATIIDIWEWIVKAFWIAMDNAKIFIDDLKWAFTNIDWGKVWSWLLEWWWKTLTEMWKRIKNWLKNIAKAIKDALVWDDSTWNITWADSTWLSSGKWWWYYQLPKKTKYKSIGDAFDMNRSKAVLDNIAKDFQETFKISSNAVANAVSDANDFILEDTKDTTQKIEDLYWDIDTDLWDSNWWWNWWWGWWWGGGSSKQVDDIEKEIENKKKKALEEIKAIKADETLSEKEKAEKILEINEKLQKDLADLQKDELELAKEKAEEIIQAEKEKVEELNEEADWYFEAMKEWYDALTDKVNEYWKEIEDLQKKQEDLKKSLSDLDINKDVDLAKRQLEVLKEIEKVREDIAEKEWKENFDKSDKSYKELLEKRAKLEEENALLIANVKKEVLEQVEAEQNKSETEKILEKYEQEKERMEQELEDLKKQEEEKIELYNQTKILQLQAEEYLTKFVQDETNKRINEMERMRDEAIKIAEEMARLWFTWNWFSAKFTKTNADGTTTTETRVINYNTINQNLQVDNTLDAYHVGQAAVQGIENNQKWMSNKSVY